MPRALLFVLGVGVAGLGLTTPVEVQERPTLVERYNFSTRSMRRDLPGPLDEVSGLAFTPDGRLFAHGDERAWVHEIDPTTGEVGKRFMFGKRTVRDDFEDVDVGFLMDGKPAASVKVYRTGDQGVLTVTDAVKDYVETMQAQLPPGVELSYYSDRSAIYKSRMNLLLKNGFMGLVLVFLVLALTLQFRLALWVSLGIAISFFGAFWAIPLFGVSLNMISMFAFIVSLGIVVDDAIVVG